MEMPSMLEIFLSKMLPKKVRKEVRDWLNSNSATVIIDQLWKAVDKK